MFESTPADLGSVDLSRAADIRYWTKYFGVTETGLRAAVASVGPQPEKVRAELRRKRLQNDAHLVLRIFVFYPSVKHREWWVLTPGSAQRNFRTAGEAVDFALEHAKSLRTSGRAVEVMEEKATGTWMRVLG